jgi:hypothetical protein
MRRTPSMRVCSALMFLGAAACRSQPQSSPNEAPDLTGQIVEVRLVRALDGVSVTNARTTGSLAGADDIQRLTVRVIGSRTTAPGMQAYVGVDGITELVRRDAPVGSGGRPELEGAFVRIWFRGAPRKATPTDLTAMARILAIDSVAALGARQ